MKENSFKALKKRKSLWRRVLSAALVAALVVGILPTQTKTASAATTGAATLNNLGALGTVTFGDGTSKSGTWYEITIKGEGDVFCLNLGKRCRTGSKYASGETKELGDLEGAVPTNEKNKVYYYVARWWKYDAKKTQKAYPYVQALIWSAEKGYTSEEELTSVIRQVRNNTNTYQNKYSSAKDMYSAIFEADPDSLKYYWQTTLTYYDNINDDSSYQQLVDLAVVKQPLPGEPEENVYEPTYRSDEARYRQRIIVNKVDEDGEPVAGVNFSLTFDEDTFSQVYTVNVNGEDVDDDDNANNTQITVEGVTDENGQVKFRITYEIASRKIWYVDDETYSEMGTADFAQIFVYFRENCEDLVENVDYPRGLRENSENSDVPSVDELIQKDLKEKIAAVSNNYILTEEDANNVDMLVDETYGAGVSVTIESDESWTKDDAYGDTSGWSDASYATLTEVTNNYKKITVDVTKINGREPSLCEGSSKNEKPHFFVLRFSARMRKPMCIL